MREGAYGLVPVALPHLLRPDESQNLVAARPANPAAVAFAATPLAVGGSRAAAAGVVPADDLPQRPRRVVAQAGAAAALGDFGGRPIGVFGPHRLKDGGRDVVR